MIRYLKGTPETFGEELIIQVNGVGYGVHVGNDILMKAQSSDEMELYIYSYVRDDRFDLYGFHSRDQQTLFELLIGVSGIGPSTALNLVEKDTEKLVSAVQEADLAFFKSVPRVGKKTAQKIIIELRGKLGEIKELSLEPLGSATQDVVDGLVGMGFDEDAAREVVRDMDVEELGEEEALKQAIGKLR